MDEKSVHSTPGRIEDKAPKPKGVIPKNTQSLVIIGVAVLMIMIMWLTGAGKKVTTNPGPTVGPPPLLTPTDTSKVQAFRQAIQSEQKAVREARGQFSSPLNVPANPPNGYHRYSAPPSQAGVEDGEREEATASAYAPYRAQELTNQPQLDPIRGDRKKRQYFSLFASNVALTYRKGAEAEKLGASPPAGLPESSPSTTRDTAVGALHDAQAQALRDAQALAAMGPLPGWARPPTGEPQTPTNGTSSGEADHSTANPEPKAAKPESLRPGELNSATGKKYILFEGTVIQTALINRLNGSLSGPVNCLVTSDVHSHDHQHVLIPAGTKVLGEAKKVTAFGQERLAVFFHRLIMPDGYSVSLDRFKGLDQVGATALRDKVNNHYTKIFGASLAVGVLGGSAQVGTANIFTQSATDRIHAGFGESMAMAGERILDRFLNILPTVTIREGARVSVYLANDLLLPDYNNHTMPPDL